QEHSAPSARRRTDHAPRFGILRLKQLRSRNSEGSVRRVIGLSLFLRSLEVNHLLPAVFAGQSSYFSYRRRFVSLSGNMMIVFSSMIRASNFFATRMIFNPCSMVTSFSSMVSPSSLTESSKTTLTPIWFTKADMADFTGVLLKVIFDRSFCPDS